MKGNQKLVELIKKEIKKHSDYEDDFNTGVYNVVNAVNQALSESGSSVVLINKAALIKSIGDLGIGI